MNITGSQPQLPLDGEGRTPMLLDNKNAVIYRAAGAVGGAMARAFAREGAHVFLTGRNLDAVNLLAKEISAAGGAAETAQNILWRPYIGR